MLDHFGINCADLVASSAFYDAVLRELGFSRQLDYTMAIGYGTDGHAAFWISAWEGTETSREVHCAFTAASEGEVRAFYDKAIELGAESLHAPRLWPEYRPGYFGAFVRDPDGNNVEAVFHQAVPDA
ncbi:MAG: VOC family protein [Dermatophilaceae bacterium]